MKKNPKTADTKIEGKIFKNSKTDKYYAVEIPSLGIHTQGKSKNEAFEMAKDALETIVAEKNFKVTIQPLKDGNFTISANDMKPLISKTIKHKNSK